MLTQKKITTENIYPWVSNPYTGILASLAPIPLRAHDPQVFSYGGTLANIGTSGQAAAVGGAGFTEEQARLSCIGEAIERFRPYPLPEDQLLAATYNQWPLKESVIPPEAWVLFHQEQYAQSHFPFKPFTKDSRCHWVCFRGVEDGKPYWVPEEIAYLYVSLGRTHEFTSSISTGLSCGTLGQPVLLRGVQEVIERDALVGAWWSIYPIEEWSKESVERLLPVELVRKINRPHLGYRFFRILSPYSDNITLVSLIGNDWEGFCFSVGSACRETLKLSWMKSILEGIQDWHYVRYLKENLVFSSEERNEIVDFAHHAVYYSTFPEKLASTLFAQERPQISPKEPKDLPLEGLPELLKKLPSTYPVLFRNMTPPFIAQEYPTWYVLKVLIPGLQPLYGNEAFPALGGTFWKDKTLADWRKTVPHPYA